MSKTEKKRKKDEEGKKRNKVLQSNVERKKERTKNSRIGWINKSRYFVTF